MRSAYSRRCGSGSGSGIRRALGCALSEKILCGRTCGSGAAAAGGGRACSTRRALRRLLNRRREGAASAALTPPGRNGCRSLVRRQAHKGLGEPTGRGVWCAAGGATAALATRGRSHRTRGRADSTARCQDHACRRRTGCSGAYGGGARGGCGVGGFVSSDLDEGVGCCVYRRAGRRWKPRHCRRWRRRRLVQKPRGRCRGTAWRLGLAKRSRTRRRAHRSSARSPLR